MRDNFIDIHNHCAWDIDDGMKDIQNARISLAQAQSDGIKAIIATPHFIPGQQSEEAIRVMNERIGELTELAKQFDIDVYPGSELFMNDAYLDMIEDQSFNTLANTNYVLVEFNVRKELSRDTHDVEDRLYEIKVRGYIPVIAHVERYFHKKIDMERVQEWVDMGYIIQINRTSILGMNGDVCQHNAKKLIEGGCAHIIASDTHRSNGTRICVLSDAFAYIKKQYGEETANILCKENPWSIIQGDAMKSIPEQKKSVFQRLWKRS